MGRAGVWGALAFLVVLLAVAAVLLVVVPLAARRRARPVEPPVDYGRARAEAADRAAAEAAAFRDVFRARARARWEPAEVSGEAGATVYQIRRVADLPDGTREVVGEFHVRTVPADATLSDRLDAQGAAIALADEHNEGRRP